MAVIPAEIGHAPIPEVQTPVAIPEITLLPGEPVSLGTTSDNIGTPNYDTIAGQTGSAPTPEEEREKAEVENYRGMGGILSTNSFRYARRALAAYPNGDSSPLNRELLSIEVFSGVMLTERQRYLYRALRTTATMSTNGKELPSDPRLFADVIFPLTGSGKRSRRRRARFERGNFSHVFAQPVR